MWKCLRIVKMHFSEMCRKFAITFHWLTITTCYYQRNHVHILISHFENFTQIFCQLWLVEQIFYENFYGFDKLLKVLHKLQVSSQIKVLITCLFKMPKRNLNAKSSVILFSNFSTRRFSWFTFIKYCDMNISLSGFWNQDFWFRIQFESSDRNKINDNGLSQLLLEQRRINSFYLRISIFQYDTMKMVYCRPIPYVIFYPSP